MLETETHVSAQQIHLHYHHHHLLLRRRRRRSRYHHRRRHRRRHHPFMPLLANGRHNSSNEFRSSAALVP